MVGAKEAMEIYRLNKIGNAAISTPIGNVGPVEANEIFYAFFVQGRRQPTQSQLIQICSVDWTDVYDTDNIEHRTEPVRH